ncbi:hypothetical protein C483_02096 [Natrialba hulunbeirensis JCM 10989]|uniref:HTH iclR-type domain-containing protein n=1 Tax=Natrialba hulunbeirensis JCM 10989 TaxID=1227493 RepID=M0AB75_9EURY|nr:hypothetical protein [Natrialba hulunbeirensis]ELY95117.1 hypothetical protein C483_02096 [Natrialba hulunbeirensis JCM 10989]
MHRPVSVGLVAIGVFLVALGIGATVVLGASAGVSGDTGTTADIQPGEMASQSLSPQSQTEYSVSNTDTQYPVQQTTQQSVSPTQQGYATQQEYVPDSREFDSRTFEITVHENGSATWTFRYEQRLDATGNETDPNTPENFEAFAEEFEAEETEFYQRFVEQAHSLTDSGSEITDREMEASDFDRRATVEGQINPMGVVEMSFTWHEFAVSENGTLVIGDVFQSVYLSSDQSIDIQPGDGLVFEHAEPDPEYVGPSLSEADIVQWEGEREFLAGHPRVVFEYEDGDSGGVFDTSVPSLFGEQSTGTGLAALAVVLVAVAGLALAGRWYRTQRRTGASAGVGMGADTDTGNPDTNQEPSRTFAIPGFGGGTESEADADSGPQSNADSVSPGTNNSTPTEAGEPTNAGSSGPTPEPLSEGALLTDEDRVVELIRENGGRMKQVNIVDETGWSKSKVSMLLSEMEDEGTISKLRVGRENIISLEGFEPEATKSPFDEQ